MATAIASQARRAVARAQDIAGKTYNSGHLRRARARFDRAMEGRKPEDILIQASAAAFVASVFLRLLRDTPIGALAVRWAPMGVFAAVYQYRHMERGR
jgi:hypothetical protein